MKKIVAAIVMLMSSPATAQYYNYGTGSNSNSHQVDGYTNSRGTYVDSYRRTNPNGSTSDNYGAAGNYNPYNGRTGRGW